MADNIDEGLGLSTIDEKYELSKLDLDFAIFPYVKFISANKYALSHQK